MKVETDDLVAQATAARMRGVSKQAIAKLIKRGKLRSVVIDGHPFLYKKEVENFTPAIGGRPRKSETSKRGSRKTR